MLIAILGIDQHETGALAVTAMLRAAGMEVIYLGRFASPESVAAGAVEESADVVGIIGRIYIKEDPEQFRQADVRGSGRCIILGGRFSPPRSPLQAGYTPSSSSGPLASSFAVL